MSEDPARRLEQLAGKLIEIAAHLALARCRHRAAGLADIFHLTAQAVAALLSASEMLPRERPDDTRAWAEWLHDAAAPVNAITGWLSILRRTPSRKLEIRAAELIERNVQALTRVLKEPPSDGLQLPVSVRDRAQDWMPQQP
jgi:hypothetical protein